MKRLFVAAALAASAAVAQPASAPAPAAAPPAMPKPAAEMRVEWWFVGSWSCKGQQHAGPMGPEMPTESKLEFKNTLGGFWLHMRGTAMSGPMKGHEYFAGYAGWDGTQHQRWDFQPGGFTHYTTKGWDGDKMVFEGEGSTGGQKTAFRHTITKKGDNEFSSMIESGGKPFVEETCTRAAKK